MKSKQLVKGMACFGLLFSLAVSARADTDLNLLGERFKVSATWRTPDGARGAAQAVPLTSETGLFWFFSPTNVELVVKVLNACNPYGGFWVYASGLTDVEVFLTVEDTVTGESKTYQRPAGTLFTPLADTTTFKGCDAVTSCGQGTEEQIAATPWANAEAEVLALMLGSGVTADPSIYGRLVDDLARIRTAQPSLADVTYLPVWESSDLFVVLTAQAATALDAGTFHEWDCLNDWYSAHVTHIYATSDALLHFEGRFHPARIGADYAALPGIVSTSPNHLVYPAALNNDLCVSVEGTAYDYFFFDELEGKTTHIRVAQSGAAPVIQAQVGDNAPRPAWWPLVEQCRADFAQAALH